MLKKQMQMNRNQSFLYTKSKKQKKQRVFNKQHLNNYCISNDWPNNNSPVSVVKIQT